MRNERGARKYTSTSAAAMYKTVNPSSTAVKKLPPTSICRQAKQSRYHGGMDARKQRVLGFQTFGIGLEDVVKAQVVRGEQKREQKKRGTEQGKIRGENTGAADEAEAGRRKAQRARYKPVVQGYAAQANAEAAQDDLRLAVPGIAEQVFIAVVKHGAAGFIRHSDAVHDENKGGEHSGQVPAQGCGKFRAGDAQRRGRGQRPAPQRPGGTTQGAAAAVGASQRTAHSGNRTLSGAGALPALPKKARRRPPGTSTSLNEEPEAVLSMEDKRKLRSSERGSLRA